MNSTSEKKSRYGMVIDLDKCNGCGACSIACAVENNVPPAEYKANKRSGITWMQIHQVENNESYPHGDTVFVPMFCQQCENETPCMTVCPQNAVDIDPSTGIVGQIPQRCLGCRYCMTACPYHARYFNWWDPQWTDGMKTQLNPDVAPRMRGVVEKCNFCHSRLHAAREKAAAKGSREIDPEDYIPACVESCPNNAITFGDLNDAASPVSILAQEENTFRLLSRLGTEPKVYFHSERAWVKEMAERAVTRTRMEEHHG
ncbi:MAG: 4Fe-4S dicluster domain-containing protein [Bacteroidota bacterium]|jgi:molybdopterin-containing oxidoreductase family iron-sulfur binding subunit